MLAQNFEQLISEGAAAQSFLASAMASASQATGQIMLANPYPRGLSVAGTGPNNTATLWQVAFHTKYELWCANSGFGLAPIFTDSQLERFADTQTPENLESIGQTRLPLIALPNEWLAFEASGARELFIETATGGSQVVQYAKNSAGYWIPTSAQGFGPPSNDEWLALVAVAVLIVAVVVTAGAAGAFAPAVVAGGDVGAGAAVAGDVAVDTSAITAAGGAAEGAGADVAADVSSSIAVDTGGAAAAGGTPAAAGGGAAAAATAGGVTVAQGVGFLGTALSAIGMVSKLIGGKGSSGAAAAPAAAPPPAAGAATPAGPLASLLLPAAVGGGLFLIAVALSGR